MHAEGTVLKRRWRIGGKLASGGLSIVYEGVDVQSGESVAIKQVLSHATDRAAARRFEREAACLARVCHPGIVRVHEAFYDEGLPTIVMERVHGQTLHEALPPGLCMPWLPAVQLVKTMAEILEHLHSQDPPIVFRDFKPNNVMLTEDGSVKLIDFGIAWTASGTAALTQAVGTPGYAPPEQYHTRDACDPRMDIYALGATTYRMLVGQDPPASTVRIAAGGALSALDAQQPPLPPEVTRLVRRMLGLQPKERPQTAGEVARAIERILYLEGLRSGS